MRFIFFLLFFYPSFALAIPPSERLPDPALEARAQNLYAQLRCVVCESQSVAGSPSEMAAALRAAVREKLAAGETDAAILAYMQSRYGDAVLMKPPVKPSTWLLWLAPFLALGAGGVIVARAMKGKS